MKSWLVDVTVEGLNLERCIRQCAAQGIELRRLRRSGRRMEAQVRRSRLDALCRLTSDGGWQLQTGRSHGLGRVLQMLGKRWLLCLAGLLGAAAVLLSVTVMWRVEVRGAGAYAGDIRAALQALGIAAPAWRSDVDPSQVRDALEYRYPRIAWIECGWRGATLLITVHQGVAAGETAEIRGCCDVVAERDGVIESIVTLAGTPVVRPGQTVRKGQVLIRGEERGADETWHPVAARGQITARVWDAATVRISAREQKTVYTGRCTERLSVRLPWFDLTQRAPAPYVQADVSTRHLPLGGLFIPLVIDEERILEATITEAMRDEDQLKAEAAVIALRKLHEKTGTADKLIDKWVEYSTIDDGGLQAVAYGERLMEIGVRGNRP